MSATEADFAFMRRALEHAREAEREGEVPVGAVLVDASGAVLATAGNATIRLNDPTAHAEILALRAAGLKLANYRLTGSTLYVTLEPCSMCASALVHARVARLVFAAADPKTGACGSIMDLVRHERLNHRLEVAQGVLGEEAGDLLKRFFRSRR
jgi:tRNA(adenine34) deaminase